jgi:hypothetical protein
MYRIWVRKQGWKKYQHYVHAENVPTLLQASCMAADLEADLGVITMIEKS